MAKLWYNDTINTNKRKNIMIYIKEIAKALNISVEAARSIFMQMCADGFDFSASSKKAIIDAAKAI